MTENKKNNRLERLIKSLTITETQKFFLQEKVTNFYYELRDISQRQTLYWSTLYLSKDTHQYILDRFWFRGSFDRGLFIKNRYDIDLYFVYRRNSTYPNEKTNLKRYLLFELLYSNLKVYQHYYREKMKLLKEPPYSYVIPIRMDYEGISILFNCIPAIELNNGYIIIPKGLEETKKINMKLEEKVISELNKKQNGQIIKLIILIKYWNFNWGNPLRGYLIEHLVEFIFDKIEVQRWDLAIKTFFKQAVYILDKEIFLHIRTNKQYSLLDEYSNNELNNFLEILHEAEINAQKGEWEKLFSDII
ncbi:MAG: hypothetical protein ACFE9T_12410 [Promethearchaeota archaeon]